MKGLIVAAIGAPFFWWGAQTYPILSLLVYVLLVVAILLFWTGAIEIRYEKNHGENNG